MKRRKFTDEEIKKFKKLYPTTRTEKLSEIFNISNSKVYNRAHCYGLKKTDEYMKKSRKKTNKNLMVHGAKYRFKEGWIPHSKGKKLNEFMCEESIKRIKKTQFKKGNKPHNTREVGAIVEDGEGYLKVKVAHPNQWEYLQRLIYEKEVGAIPKGYCVTFKDGNNLNLNSENLEAVSRSGLMKNNTIHRYPQEFIQLIRRQSRLVKIIKDLEGNK